MLGKLLRCRERLDRLAAAESPRPTLADRAARLVGLGPAPEPLQLVELDRAIERAGIHTLADAKLLAELVRTGARAGGLARGLRRRTGRALAEFSRLLSWHERQRRLDPPLRESERARLEELYARLVRAVKVAELLRRPDAPLGDPYEPLPRPPEARPPPSDPRVAVGELLADRALGPALDYARKRRDLEAAHELLLRLGSEVERDRVRAVRARVAAARAELGRGFGSPVAQMERACRAGDGAQAWSAAMGLYRAAIAGREPALAAAARQVLATLEHRVPGGLAAAVDANRAAVFLDAVDEAGLIADQLAEHYGTPCARDRLAELALDLDAERWSTFDLAVGAGRFFDVEEEEVEDEGEPPVPVSTRWRRVPHPTGAMGLDVTSDVSQLPGFVVSDPRTILYDVASGRQLVRAWYAPEGPAPSRRRGRGSVRVYVCDASGSMAGARARFRDAVLIAELNNLSVREARGLPKAPLYFSFFTDHPSALERVDSPAAALRVIRSLFRASPAEGRTDITYALESAFAAIHDARGRDPDLGRATVVLVTDGEDRLDLERIRAARAPVGEIEVTLSFISLGRENADLRHLVLEQRESGRRAFYHHLTDDEVAGARSVFDSSLRTLLPARPRVDLAPDDPELAKAIEALAAAADPRRGGAPIEVSPATRFDAYFPPPERAGDDSAATARERALAADLLGAVAEALALAPAEARPGEAVLLLEHLLREYRVQVPRYLGSLAAMPRAGREALERIRLLCGATGGGSWVSSTG